MISGSVAPVAASSLQSAGGALGRTLAMAHAGGGALVHVHVHVHSHHSNTQDDHTKLKTFVHFASYPSRVPQ